MPDQVALQNESATLLLEAVARLTTREQDLIGLKFGAGLTTSRIAEITGLKQDTVGVILYRAVRRLRDSLQTKENIHGRT